MLILGSQSPRRKEILSLFSLPFKQTSSAFTEEDVLFQGDPIRYVTDIARGKADDLAPQFPQDIILTADTTVYYNGEIFNKPADEAEAFQMLKKLAGHWHSVYTALVIRHHQHFFHQVEETRVLFNFLTDQQIQAYCEKTDYLDKAGSYAIQGASGLIVKRIEGCYYNVMGLPINTLWHLLQYVDINLWDYLR